MIQITGQSLTLEEINQVALDFDSVSLSPDAEDKIQKSHPWVEDIISKGDPIYGINTGYGVFANRKISCRVST